MTVVAVAPPSSSVIPPYHPSWIPKHKRSSLGRRSSFSGRSNLRRLKLPPRAALVEANRSYVVPAIRDGSSSVKVCALPAGRADDLQAEARAMPRSANASVFSTQLLVDKYGSQPFKEGHNARRFSTLYVDEKDIFVPDVFWDYLAPKY